MIKTNYFIKEQEKSDDEKLEKTLSSTNLSIVNNIEEHKSEYGVDMIPMLTQLDNLNLTSKIDGELNTDIQYSTKVLEYIKTHQQWKDSKMRNRGQSKDLYRNDNLGK